MSITVKDRVINLEQILADYIASSSRTLDRMEADTRALKKEMGDFKQEMKEFKDEMKEFKDEMKEFKDEMGTFKDRVTLDIIEMREDRRRMNKQWGDLANKMGTIVEDIVLPATRPVLEKYFGEELLDLAIHYKRKDKKLKLEGEFDVVAVSKSFVFLIETKATPSKQYLLDFQRNIERFKKLFPGYSHLKLIPVFASLRFEKRFIEIATERGFYLMAYREWDYMDILNFEMLHGQND